ncbi:pteridine reductase [Thioalkalivibrio sp. XN8]|uniref:pteridine reductase n=1 Tax=Thioalkalivibrio sp. XN8 TaxID=2712863 RepID=UPI0019820A20|nr:pteridine reductase [Thioalkalivibrio sp. XN8]
MSNDTDNHSLAGRVALVTGGARRIGAAVAEALHEAGAKVAVHYRGSRDEAVALVGRLDARRPGSALALPADLLDTAALPGLVDQVAAAFGGLDLLVNNASSFYPTPVGSITEQHWDELVGSNLKAPLFLSQAAAPLLRRRHGLIVNLVDVHARRPMPGYPVYCAAKAGLEMLTYALAHELGPEVRVNGIAPGAILWPEAGASEAEQAATLAGIPLKRTGAPADIAACVLFLAGAGSYVNGQVIAVDGGRHLGF